MGFAASRQRGDDSGIERKLGAMPEGQTVCDDFDASLVSDRDVEVHVGKLDVSCDPGASFAADPCNGVLKGQRACGEDAGGGAGRAVVAEGVQCSVAAAPARSEWEGQAQAP